MPDGAVIDRLAVGFGPSVLLFKLYCDARMMLTDGQGGAALELGALVAPPPVPKRPGLGTRKISAVWYEVGLEF